MLDNPPEPTERMKKAALTYQKIINNAVWAVRPKAP
jgi:uncharacterized protein (DUF1778 family)